MNTLWQVFDALQGFAVLGGGIVWVLFGVCFLLWYLILERLIFLRLSWPRVARRIEELWIKRTDRCSWRALAIREAQVSQACKDLHGHISLVRTLVSLCPLLGLLGTVLGMVGVFEVIAVSGNDDPQAMASGIYRATIPTMAGLVVALTGIYFTVRLGRLAERESQRLRARLVLEGEEVLL